MVSYTVVRPNTPLEPRTSAIIVIEKGVNAISATYGLSLVASPLATPAFVDDSTMN